MNTWDDDYTREAIRASAEMLADFANELQQKLTDGMTPEEAIYLLRQISNYAASMTHLAEMATPK
jgi:hypothetical protein